MAFLIPTFYTLITNCTFKCTWIFLLSYCVHICFNAIIIFDSLFPKYTFLRGYTAPEYAMHGQLSEKADTYSYGVVVLEIISGQKSGETKDDVESEFLLQRVRRVSINYITNDLHYKVTNDEYLAQFMVIKLTLNKICRLGNSMIEVCTWILWTIP